MIVSIDVPALRGVISDLNDAVDLANEERSAVSAAAHRAVTSAPSLSGLYEHTGAISDAVSDLQARIDLAILVNTGDDGQVPDDGVLTYEVSSDSISMVKFEIGRELADATDPPLMVYDPEALAAYQETFARYTDDDTVMTAFYSGIEPEGLLIFMSEVARRDVNNYGVDLELQQRMLDSLQDGLETASDAWSPGYAERYAEDLVQAATQDPHDGDSHHLVSSFPGALSHLLYDSNYSDAFLTSAADALDNYERLEVDGSEGTWEERSMGAGNNFLDLFPYEASAAHFDPMVGLMSALGNNADVSLDFFTGGANDGADRQMYWIHDRKWMHDQFLHMSEALLAATTDQSLIDPPDGPDAARAANLVSTAVNLLGHREGIGFYDAGFFGTDMERSEAASENFATMLATYMHGVDETLLNGPEYDPEWDGAGTANPRAGYYPGVIPNVPLFNMDSLRNFIVYASGNEEGLLTLRAGLNEYTARKYALAADYLQEGGVDDQTAQDVFEQAYLGQARMEGAFVDAVGDAAIARAAGEDAVREQWASLAEGAVSAIPVGKLVTAAGGGDAAEAIIGFAVDQGISNSASELQSEWASLEEAERELQRGVAEETLAHGQYNVFTALNEAGLVPDPALQDTWAPNGQLLSYNEFSELDSGDQAEALSWLRNVEDGVGGVFNPFDYEQEFNNQFNGPWE